MIDFVNQSYDLRTKHTCVLLVARHTGGMDELIQHMLDTGILRTPRIIDAFRAIDRVHFVPPESASFAHLDEPIHIGHQQTISQPSTVAFMLELLDPRPGQRILDIGSGSGWTTALLAHIVGREGSVLGLERVEELVAFGQENIARFNLPDVRIERAGTELGAPKGRPYDRILVSAAARSFHHELVPQLVEGGILVIPVRNAIWRAVRVEHQPIIDKYEGYVFVPLIVN